MLKISKAMAELREAEDRLYRTLKEELRPGTPAVWQVAAGQREKKGEIVELGHRDRIKVRNPETNASYWIRAYQLIDYGAKP